jgi:hypothetical protein
MDKFKVGDKVLLPFDETGTIVEIKNIIWGFKYVVKIRKATFNKTNQHVDYKEEQLKLES